MSRKRTLLSLLILSICPFVFHVIGSACSGNETVNGHKASFSNAVCALVDSDSGSDLRSVSSMFCPQEETFAFHVIGSACSGNGTVNGQKASSSNAVCALVDAECGSDLRSVSDLFCPRGKNNTEESNTPRL